MSVNTKNGSENESVSCGTNPGSGSPLATPEPKANSHATNNSRTDLQYPNFHSPPRIYQQNVKSSKIFRILTVLAYMVAVSMAAILLSIYYTFIWKNPYSNPGNVSEESVSRPQMPSSRLVNSHHNQSTYAEDQHWANSHMIPPKQTMIEETDYDHHHSLHSLPILSMNKQTKNSALNSKLVTPVVALMLYNGTNINSNDTSHYR